MSKPLVRSPLLITAYRNYLHSTDAVGFAEAVESSYTVSTLVRLLSHGDTELRCAAALALGTLGNGSILDDIGRALSDSDRGVRLVADDTFRLLSISTAAPIHQQHLLSAMHLVDGGRHDDALEELELLTRRAPRYAEAHYQRGLCLRALGAHRAAGEAYAACLWRCRFHYLAWIGLARCRIAEGSKTEALTAFRRAVAIHPDSETARLAVRTLQRRLGG